MTHRTGRGPLYLVLTALVLLSACQASLRATPEGGEPTATLGVQTNTPAATNITAPSSTPTTQPGVQPTLHFTQSPPSTCASAPVLPEISSQIDALIPSPTDNDWWVGSEDARITVYFYTDFQCPICAGLGLNLRALQEQYPEDVRLVLRYVINPEGAGNAQLAAQAAEAAGLQGQFWQMTDLLNSSWADWVTLTEPDFVSWLTQQSAALDLDSDRFIQDFQSPKNIQSVQSTSQASLSSGMIQAPVLFFNKFPYDKWWDLNSLTNVVEYFKLPDRAYTSCPAMTLDPAVQYHATLETEKGEIVIELFPQVAPMAVQSFIFLSSEGWYDKATFFRVIPGFLVQTGDPSGSGFGKPGYQFTNEVRPEIRFDQPGRVALANSGDGTNGSQFFITYAPLPQLDGQYTIFGQVVEGMDVLESLRPRNPDQDQVLFQADPLISVSIEEH